MPRATPYPSNIHALISSISYPDLPGPSELDALRATLEQQSAVVAADLEKKLRREKKRKERDDPNYPSEAAALEANGRAGMKLEALERARLESTAKRASPSTVKVKRERLSASPAPSNASSVSFRPPATHSQPITYGGTQLKKKKNRVLDSDDEAKSQARDRSTTLASPPPHLSHMNSTSVLKLKLNSGLPAPKGRPSLGHVDASPTPSGSTAAATHFPGAAIDFSLPPQTSKPLIPPRPGVQKPLKAGPKRQSEVDEDFSNTKAPNQVAFTTFWSSVEPYLRDIREDDLAMLEFKAEAPELYDIPPKGRHYTEIWDEEDGNPPGTTPRLNVPSTRQSHRATATNHFVPVTEFKDEFLFDEQKGLGSLTERIVAAIVADVDGANVKREETAGRPIPEHEVTKEPSRVDVFDLEDRMKKELRALMLLGEHEEYDPSKRDDDEIASSLRQCQRLLLQQTAVNDARKTRLAEIARHRLAHGEYTNALEGIEKSIEAGWNKRVTKYKVTGKKNITPGTVPPLQSNRAPVPENLRRLVKVRQGWIENVGKLMKDRPKGEVNGLPTSSIYEGIGEDGGAEERDEKVVEDAMDIDSIADGEEVANGL